MTDHNWKNDTSTELGTSIGLNLDASSSALQQYPNWLVVIIYVISPIGIVLNSVFLFTVARVPSLRTPTTYYLVNLALADITFLVFNIFRAIVTSEPVITNETTLTFYSRVFIEYIVYILGTASAFTIVALSVERFVAIYKPVKFRKIISESGTIKSIAAIWLVSALVSVPIFPLHLVPTAMKKYEAKILWIFLYIPPMAMLLVVMVLYSTQIVKLYHHQKRTRNVKRSHIDRYQVVVMLTITSVVFFVCITPYIIHGLIWISGVTIPMGLKSAGLVFLNINSGVNMIIYNVVSSKYRHALISAFRKQTFQVSSV